jgi:hypothetical protein
MKAVRVGSPGIPGQKSAKSPVPTVRGNSHRLPIHDLGRVMPQVPKRPKPAQTRTSRTTPIVPTPLTPPSVVPKEMMNLMDRHGVSGGLRGCLPSGLLFHRLLMLEFAGVYVILLVVFGLITVVKDGMLGVFL